MLLVVLIMVDDLTLSLTHQLDHDETHSVALTAAGQSQSDEGHFPIVCIGL